MKRNVGKTDRIIRVVIGILILGVGAYYRSWWGLIGLIPLLTGLVGFCTLYSIFGVSTRTHGRGGQDQSPGYD